LVLTKIMAAHHEFQENPYPRSKKRHSDAQFRPLQFLVAMCDLADALRSKRGYKEGWEPGVMENFMKPVFGQDLSLLRSPSSKFF
jgi:hypothetical protein